MTERLAALKASDHSVEFWGNAKPKCPHCGDDYDIDENEAYHLYDVDEGDHIVECPSCDLTFSVAVRASFSFNTDEQEEEYDDE